MTEMRLADDLIWGADALARELFGDPEKKRRIYQLKFELPLFHVGQVILRPPV